MLTSGEVGRLQAFLRITSKASLFEYLSVGEHTSLEECQRRVDERRRWAQAQQANPRYREESLWLLRNGGFFERLLVDEQSQYRVWMREQQEEMPPETEEEPQDEGFPNHYETLGLGPSASKEEIETAHRSRYRWARSLRDRERAEQVYDKIAAAWSVLSDPSRRAGYDVAYRDYVGLGPEWEEDEGVERQALALLGPPESQAPAQTPPAPSRPTPDTQSRLRRRAPGDPKSRLIARGRWPRRIHAGGPITREAVDVQLGGPAPIWVSVSSTRSWLQCATERFLLEPEGHRLVYSIDPNKMESSKGSGRIVLVAANGERLDLIVEASRGLFSARRLFTLLSGLCLLLGLGQVTGLLPLQVFLGSPKAVVTTVPIRLEVFCDPGADAILVDGVQVGQDCPLKLGSEVPFGRSFRLEARLEGFRAKSQTLSVHKGRVKAVRMELALDSPMDFRPISSMQIPANSAEVAQAALKAIHSQKNAILSFMKSTEVPRLDRALTSVIYLAAEGHVSGIDFHQASLEGTPMAGCIKRQLRAIHTPEFSGDYLGVEYKFPNTEPSKEGPHEE